MANPFDVDRAVPEADEKPRCAAGVSQCSAPEAGAGLLVAPVSSDSLGLDGHKSRWAMKKAYVSFGGRLSVSLEDQKESLSYAASKAVMVDSLG